MPKTIIHRIELTASAKATLAKVSDRHGMTQIAMMSRLIEFFATQPDTFKAAMVGAYPPEIQAEAAKLILKQLE